MLDVLGNYALPLTVAAIIGYGMMKRVKVFDCFLLGVKKGIATLYEIMPNIVALVFAVTLMEASGGMEILGKLMTPFARLFGVPGEVAVLGAVSPISGGGSLTMYESILTRFGPDSFEGRVASVIMGSTETTLYAVTVYFGAVSIKKTEHTLLAGLCADFVGLALSAAFVRLTLGG